MPNIKITAKYKFIMLRRKDYDIYTLIQRGRMLQMRGRMLQFQCIEWYSVKMYKTAIVFTGNDRLHVS